MTREDHELARTFGEIAQVLYGQESLQARLDTVTRFARTMVDGCDEAGVVVFGGRRRMEVTASTDHNVDNCIELQRELGEGPVTETDWDGGTCEAGDMTHENRWPRFAPRAVELGIRGLLAFDLSVDSMRLGSLSLYSGRPFAFGREARETGAILAAHAAVALGHARTQEQLREAISTRHTIGAAVGILMGREGVGEDRAFELLRSASRDFNIRLRDVASRLVDTENETADDSAGSRAALEQLLLVGEAKGLLAGRRGVTLDEASRLLQEYADTHDWSLPELARAVIHDVPAVAELGKGSR